MFKFIFCDACTCTGVGDVCSFAEMNLRKHGHSEVIKLMLY